MAMAGHDEREYDEDEEESEYDSDGDLDGEALQRMHTFGGDDYPKTVGEAMCSPARTCNDLCREFRKQEDRLSMFHESRANRDWPTIFGSSPWFKPTSIVLVMTRFIFFAIFSWHMAWSMLEEYEVDPFWFIYLTHWSLLVETLYFFFAFLTAFKAYGMLVIEELGEGTLPWYVTVTWILQHVAVPAGALVTALYWTFLDPIWGNPNFRWLNVFVHAANYFLLLIDLLLSWNVFYLKHVAWFYLYTVLYVIWTLIHYWAKIGTPGCTDYPPEECPIYDVLDWHKPTVTGVLGAMVFVIAIPAVSFGLWWVVYKRRSVGALVRARRQKGRP